MPAAAALASRRADRPLADSCFAYVCNSYNSYNRNTLASACGIDFLAPAKEGVEQSLAGRSGVYDVTVKNGDGVTVALFRGKSHRIADEVIETLGATNQLK